MECLKSLQPGRQHKEASEGPPAVACTLQGPWSTAWRRCCKLASVAATAPGPGRIFANLPGRAGERESECDGHSAAPVPLQPFVCDEGYQPVQCMPRMGWGRVRRGKEWRGPSQANGAWRRSLPGRGCSQCKRPQHTGLGPTRRAQTHGRGRRCQLGSRLDYCQTCCEWHCALCCRRRRGLRELLPSAGSARGD